MVVISFLLLKKKLMTETRLSERDVRIQKIDRLKSFGIVPYAQKFDKQIMIEKLVSCYGKELEGESPFRSIEEILESPDAVSGSHFIKTAGRLTLLRWHGSLTFARLMDESGEIQLMFHKKLCSVYRTEGSTVLDKSDVLENSEGKEMTAYKMVDKLVDVGDFLWVEGELFYTNKGELTLFVSAYTFLAKAIRPLGDKFHGVAGQESAYRQRYLDMIHNRETLERMKLRSTFVKTLREFYWENDFMEIETPVLGTSASGAAAKPFVTRHEEYDMDVYLHIAPETSLKKATVGWLEKVFEFSRNFRNEWSSPIHVQEFTAIEHYAVYWNYEDNMSFTEKMFDYLFDKIPALSKIVKVEDKQWNVSDVDFSTPWARLDYVAQIKKDSWIDVSLYGPWDENLLRAEIEKMWHQRVWLDVQTTATMIDYLYKKVTRPKIVGPAFIYNYPKTMQPLARVSDSDDNIVEQFQLVVNGWEVLKAYGEMVNPLTQQENFDAQSSAIARGDEEATSWDDDFVESMEYGMPPQSWWGMGIDRILALLTEQKNTRDVILFPLMKPKGVVSSAQEDDDSVVVSSSVSVVSEGADLFQDSVCVPYKRDNASYPSLEIVEQLAKKHLVDTYRHCQEVGDVMRAFAQKLWKDEDEQHVWYVTWLLHDLDWDEIEKDADEHMGDRFLAMMKEIDAPQSLIDDIRSHYSEKWYAPVDSELRKYLISIDELSGFLYAYSLMRPEWYKDMKWKSINKKLKDKKFAAGVDREHVKYCEKYLNIPVNEFALDVAKIMADLYS